MVICRVRLILWTLLVALGATSLVQGQSQGAGNQPVASVYTVTIDSTINPGALGKLTHAIAVAEANGAAALIVRIDTPGGLLSTTRDMVRAISEAQVPVIGYVGPDGASATSAGAFILLATHVAAMTPGTNVGAATPVSGSGDDIRGAMASKVMNDTRALMRGVAESRGRNADVAERFVTEAESLTAREAREAGVIDLVVADLGALLAALDGREIQFAGATLRLALAEAELRAVSTRWIDQLLTWLAHPQIAHMLIALGSLAIYIEIISPGLAFPGVFGAIAVVLGLVCLQTLPVNTGFQILLLLGLVLLIAEYFVAGFGVLGIGGAAAFILGSLYLFDEPLPGDYTASALTVSIGVGAAMLAGSALIGSSLWGGWQGRRLTGKTGQAMVSFDHHGIVLVAGKRWPAETLEPLRHGDPVIVVSADTDGRLIVRKSSS